ncbi:YbfB/YjiJ family MFS transporter [Lichenibacterium ramalinae]|uniref:YbfB/YjiJ family MFS transporter n=1 Tax=Lichenibacterium ramalinae TaxID=2316527 RepID=A0A4Q2RCS3_9HYPH|nr:YbfB/YjiJ family MFS transporter [Lichenibacterium ramalinae]RYB04425.1 YbfB/YjiJ family MFS transporter [Lichenibacterium ramalinae]
MTAVDARSPTAEIPHHPRSSDVWRWVCAGLSASLVGLGLARFAYTPLIPALIDARWFAPADVVYLGAANLAGYLAGALMARGLAARFGAVPLLRASMVTVTLSCLACAVPLSFPWFLAWRLASGVAGALIMVLAASTILPHVGPARRGLVGGAVFAGVGLGIAASGTLVPLLLRMGLAACWYGLAVLSALLTLVSWPNWPRAAAPHREEAGPARASSRHASRTTRALIVEYGLVAFALVPHMVFLVDYVARGLGQGLDAGAGLWVVYGLGAIVGPLLAGHLADRAGFGPALRVAYLAMALAIVAVAFGTAVPILVASSLVVGGFTPGIVPLVLGRIHELVPHDAAQQRTVWARATTSFAVGQAVGAYGLSFVVARGLVPPSGLFVLGGAAAACALAINLTTALTVRSSHGSDAR